VREDWFELGASEDLPIMWRDSLLRQLSEPTRYEACRRNESPRHCVSPTRRTLALLLSWWEVCWVL